MRKWAVRHGSTGTIPPAEPGANRGGCSNERRSVAGGKPSSVQLASHGDINCGDHFSAKRRCRRRANCNRLCSRQRSTRLHSDRANRHAPQSLSGQTGRPATVEIGVRRLLDLARGVVCRAPSVTSRAVRSYRTISPLPVMPAKRLVGTHRRYVFCGTVPDPRPADRWALPTAVPCRARTFLPHRFGQPGLPGLYERSPARDVFCLLWEYVLSSVRVSGVLSLPVLYTVIGLAGAEKGEHASPQYCSDPSTA